MLPVTVVIPTKDRPALLRRALDSVLAQRTGVEAVIVVDDGSQAPVAIEDAGEIVTVCRHSTSLGPSSARNAGVRSARTRWVTFLDDDVELDADFASELAAVFSGTPDADFIWSGVQFRRSDGSIQGERTFRDLATDRDSICREALDVGTGYGLTVLAERFADLSGFDESLRLTEDTDFIIRAIGAGLRPAVIRSPMVKITNHDGDRQTGGRNDEQRIRECQTILAKYSLDGDMAYVADWLRQRIADLKARLSGARFITKCEGFAANS